MGTDPRPLPLAGPAEACALDQDEYRTRITHWRELLRDAHLSRAGRGSVWTLPSDRTKDLVELVAAEQSCCAFLDLRVEGTPTNVLLHVGIEPGRNPSAGSPGEEAARLLGALPDGTG